ncbi:TonB-dependent receptor plug domain-containing protein [Mongoliitalea daihaiensis]|nr:TonB-dependent receptor plug domain-containing protein [Mongoliitalea daihaiensis]
MGANALLVQKQDTLELNVVEVKSPDFEKYAAGQQLISIQEKHLQDFQGDALTEVLQRRTGLFLRQQGPGMLASLTMRGTSTGHNAVFWNGLPINSPSLGQADFSILPTAAIDRVDIHLGSSGALYGTDAIGGAIHLGTRQIFNQGHRLDIGSIIGSFGRWDQSLAYSYSNQTFSTKTRAYRQYARNDFPFRNLSRIHTPIERMPNGEVIQQGFLQDLAWNLSARQQLHAAIWFNEADRQIIPIIGSNTQDQQQDRNLRAMLDYLHFDGKNTWNFKAGIVFDELIFNIGAINKTQQYFLSGEWDRNWNDRVSSRTGFRLTQIDGQLDTYEAQEQRWELYHSHKFVPRPNLTMTANLRQLIYDGNWAPFTPSIGGEWNFLQSTNQQLSLGFAVARSFKVPTLNDRFWNPGGNPELLPEDSYNSEISLQQELTLRGFLIKQHLTMYRMWVDNWIIWLPRGNIWSPENIRNVINSGLEYRAQVEKKVGVHHWSFTGTYNWVQAINQTNTSANDQSKGNQLPYTPEHKVMGTIDWQRSNWSAFISSHWVSERFVATDNQLSVAPYELVDIGIRYQFKFLSNKKITAGFHVNNLMDKEYHIMRLRPMPGRNFQFNCNISL